MKPLIEKAGLNTKKTNLDFSLRFLDYSFKLKTIMTKIMTYSQGQIKEDGDIESIFR